MRILIIEDNETHSLLLSSTVKSFGNRYDIAYDGREGVNMLLKMKYDAAFVDIRMPEVRGDELIPYIRSFPNPNQSTPLIVVSADAMKGDKERFLSIGASDYVSKPFYRSELLGALCKSLLRNVGNHWSKHNLDEYLIDKKYHTFFSLYERSAPTPAHSENAGAHSTLDLRPNVCSGEVLANVKMLRA